MKEGWVEITKMLKVEQGSEQADLAEDVSAHWREVD